MHASLYSEWDVQGESKEQDKFKMTFIKFDGTPWFQHSNYNFYKKFKYNCKEKVRTLSIGDFFFLKILQEIPVCVGEIELLWEDKVTNQSLSSLKLYIRPENTPDGRQEHTGEDEMLALGDRILLRLDDLVPLIQDDIKWEHGSTAFYKALEKKDVISKENDSKTPQNGELNGSDSRDSTENGTEKTISDCANIAIMSYSRYCRYRAMMRRLEGCENEWLHVAVVVAIGGFSSRAPGCRVMFCRDTFYQSEVDDLEIRVDHLFPVLKGKNKVKKTKAPFRKDSNHDSDSMEENFSNITPSVPTSSRPRRSTESDLTEDKVSTEEQAFLFGLHKFMHDSRTPIGRIPSLGFKQIDLYDFYKQAESLGGYDMITTKRCWKHLYDVLGGNSSNTSAATCTRKHYERLLLPYERHLRKAKVGRGRPKKKHKNIVKEEEKNLANKEMSDSSSHKENVESKDMNDVKKENNTDVEESKADVKRKMLSESISNIETDPVSAKEKLESSSTEHSSEVKPSQDVEPSVKLDTSETNIESLEHKALPNNSDKQTVAIYNLDQVCDKTEQQTEENKAKTLQINNSMAAPAPTPLASSITIGNQVIPYTNLMYQGGYLLPVQMLSPWGVLTPQGGAVVNNNVGGVQNNSAEKSALPVVQNALTGQPKESTNSIYVSETASGSKPTASSSNSTAQRISTNKAATDAHSHHKQGTITGTPKAAHTNTPYKPSPYLLNDHIQPAMNRHPGSALSAYHRTQLARFAQPNDLLGHTSHSLAPIMHPTPPGHKSELVLPSAPSSLYLHPSSTNPFSPLPVPTQGSPPAAHNHPRKRTYPFDNVGQSSSSGVFPSPDMVLNRIKNCTGLPRSNETEPPDIRQEFDDPRNAFKLNLQNSAAYQNSTSLHSRKQNQHHSVKGDTSNRHLNQKSSKSSSSSASSSSQAKRNSQLFSPYGSIPSGQGVSAIDIQKSFHPSMSASSSHSSSVSPHTTSNKHLNSMKNSGNVLGNNGYLQIPQQASKATLSSQQVAALPNSGKDGRLTSALFGAQFTAMPRSTQASEQLSVPVTPEVSSAVASAATVASMGFNPHLHSAFMSPYMPTASTSAANALNPQLQMLAGAYAASTPMQLAAYQELLRQNGLSGYTPFLPGAPQPPAKTAKKS